MNKTAIKNYAIWARVQLIESCRQRAFEYGVTEDGNYASNLKTIGSRILSDQEVEQRNQLIGQIKQKGYAQVMEEAAYTWFNRFIALRFMEANGYLPSKVRVFTDETGVFRPEILKEAMMIELEGINRSTVIELLEKQDNESLYKYLLITQCNALSDGLPYMFEKISNWTELLFPANLLRNDSIVGRMISDIPEEDWTDAVQIIGWLYQYYNSELKDETFALLKKNVKITKERIPAATQLFTPDWIVRYMVENSLGRLWYEGHKDFDKSQWKYYLDEAEQEPDVEAALAKIRADYSQIKPEAIKVIDPCMGSGHILVYAFDVLMKIYTSAGWSERDAARSIIDNNIYGLDIDDRAGQLAYFAVMMKARKYSRRIMNLDVKPNVMSIQDSSFMTNELIDFVAGNDAMIQADLRKIKEVFTNAKEYGSILNVPLLGYVAILERVDELKNTIVEDIFQIEYRNVALEQLQPLVNQAMIMSQKYDVVITNPPYMGSSGMSAKLGDFVKENYPDSKFDLFAVFIEKCGHMVKPNGYQAMITQHAWMFLSSFEKLRRKMLVAETVNMIHLGARAFDEIGGEVVQTTSFVLRKTHIKDYISNYCRLIMPTTQNGKEEMFIAGENRFSTKQDDFSKIPGTPIAYWINKRWFSLYNKYPVMRDVLALKKGTSTGDNERFIRLWQEIDWTKTEINAHSPGDARSSSKKWFPINGGGERRKWFGNRNSVVNWESDGQEMKALATELNHGGHWSRYIINPDRFFTEAIGWSAISTSKISVRYIGYGFAFSSAAMEAFDLHLLYSMALINSVVSDDILKLLAPTINYGVEQIGKIPLKIEHESTVNSIVEDNIHISKLDWDSFENSWGFKRHPLV